MPRSTEDIAKSLRAPADVTALEQKISSILVEIEQEEVPDELLKLANQLQMALVQKRRLCNPN